LIADDEPFNLIALEGLLDTYNIKCDTAYNGRQLIDKLLQNQNIIECLNHTSYELILTDNNMPEMTGIVAAREIKRLQEEE
jgi:CheY-like chemotaxis protein